MWSHALNTIRCPKCRKHLRLAQFKPGSLSVSARFMVQLRERGVSLGEWVSEGALVCDLCRAFYPITRGLPLCLTYPTRVSKQWASNLEKSQWKEIGEGYSLPGEYPPLGETWVAKSFSTEWSAYDYGDTLWTASREDRLKTFRGECGLKDNELVGKSFCEVGCGLGITTNEASERFGAEAWGMDLSAAAFRATEQFMTNPMVHFVQASIFAPPFESEQFDFIYSHGVLHHTWNTKAAVTMASDLIKYGGALYIWLYGYKDIRRSVARRIAFALESLLRPLIAILPAMGGTLLLLPFVPAYQIASLLGSRSGTHTRVYTFQQALHAARDRFSPLFAHRHEVLEVEEWLKELQFSGLHRVSGNEVSTSWMVAIDNNVALKASGKGVNLKL